MKTTNLKVDEVVSTTGHIFKKGQIRHEDKRLVRLIGFESDEKGVKYAHWQYISKRTYKPTGKSLSFLTKIQ